MHPLQWLAQHDRDYVALRRAGRTAIIMPLLFAFGDKVLDDPQVATFAAFGSFAMLLLVDFSGPMRIRLQSQFFLGIAGCALVFLGTLLSRNTAVSVIAMAVVGFALIFVGVVSSVLAAATTSLLLGFILPLTLPGPVSSVWARMAGWGMAAAVSVVAVGILWPAPVREPLRVAASNACKALAARLRAEVTFRLGDGQAEYAEDFRHAAEASDQALAALHKTFLATPYRPTGLSTSARTVVRLVDELGWLNRIVLQSALAKGPLSAHHDPCEVKLAAAAVLERGGALLEVTGGDPAPLRHAKGDLTDALAQLELKSLTRLPEEAEGVDGATAFVSSLDPSFRAQELSFATSAIADNIDLTASAERRSWVERMLGRQPEGLSGTLSAASQRATAHVEWHSVWLHNSVRGGVGLALAVLVADLTGVQHSFWVVLGTLSVLRSNALSTGQNVLRGLGGTIAGFFVGAAILQLVGTNTNVLWALLPIAILVAGVAPAVVSFAAGQAAFTLVLLILFNIISPAGWEIGLTRIEDIALGCAVSLVVGLLFWPRGAAAALRRALAEAYTDSTDYLVATVDYGMVRCDTGAGEAIAPTREALKAAAAARRLDDTFRNYLAERGAKPVPLADMTTLVTGVAGVRLAGDAVLDLWQRDDGAPSGDRAGARAVLQGSADVVQLWYAELAGHLLDHGELRDALERDEVADGRLVDAVRRDLTGEDRMATATAVRMIWTGDHLDAVRRLQQSIIEPARVTAAAGAARS